MQQLVRTKKAIFHAKISVAKNFTLFVISFSYISLIRLAMQAVRTLTLMQVLHKINKRAQRGSNPSSLVTVALQVRPYHIAKLECLN